MNEWLIDSTAFLIGFVHSLTPAHWFPMAVVSNTRRWNFFQMAAGAFVLVLGHVFITGALLILVIGLGRGILEDYEMVLERYSGLLLFVLGLGYAVWAYFSHRRCGKATHHHAQIQKKSPFMILFFVGWTPCTVILPVLLSSLVLGPWGLVYACVTYLLGVFTAVLGANVLLRYATFNLHNEFLEHRGDFLTGLTVAALGIVLFLAGH